VKFGALMFMTEVSIGPAAFGRALEARGFESALLCEHTHIPAVRESPWPLGAEMPPEYMHTLDPFVALTAIAAATDRLRVGTGICLVVERDPITLAKEVASLDVVSGGRFLFGVGAGWNLEEMRHHGTDPARRFGVLRERLEAMRRIWAEEEASYHGRYVDFERIWSWPKPLQRPHPPVLVGTAGAGTKTLQRVAEYGDEWFPLANPLDPAVDEGLAGRMEELNELAAVRGRGPIPVSVIAPPDSAVIERYRAAGVDRCIFLLPTVSEAEMESLLDQLAPLVAAYAEPVAV
jgi:probable F420-dependent oxidoreductase